MHGGDSVGGEGKGKIKFLTGFGIKKYFSTLSLFDRVGIVHFYAEEHIWEEIISSSPLMGMAKPLIK